MMILVGRRRLYLGILVALGALFLAALDSIWGESMYCTRCGKERFVKTINPLGILVHRWTVEDHEYPTPASLVLEPLAHAGHQWAVWHEESLLTHVISTGHDTAPTWYRVYWPGPVWAELARVDDQLALDVGRVVLAPDADLPWRREHTQAVWDAALEVSRRADPGEEVGHLRALLDSAPRAARGEE